MSPSRFNDFIHDLLPEIATAVMAVIVFIVMAIGLWLVQP